MKKVTKFSHQGWFFGVLAVAGFGFAALFGKEMLRSTEPKEKQFDAIVVALKKSFESPAVEGKIKELVTAVVKEANLSDVQKAALKRIVQWNKITVSEPCILGMIDICSKRDVKVLSKALDVDTATISKFDKEEQELGEKLAKGDIDSASFQLMIEKMESKPEYEPIVELRAGLKEDAIFNQQVHKEAMTDDGELVIKRMTSKLLSALLESLK